ncbi:MAG: hypothetical protein AAF717_00135 [Bacteroidota bacterium]
MASYTSEDYKKLSRKFIAEAVGNCTPQYVGQVLTGEKKDNSAKAKNIIKVANGLLDSIPNSKTA